jgi:hypothetical protein
MDMLDTVDTYRNPFLPSRIHPLTLSQWRVSDQVFLSLTSRWSMWRHVDARIRRSTWSQFLS